MFYAWWNGIHFLAIVASLIRRHVLLAVRIGRLSDVHDQLIYREFRKVSFYVDPFAISGSVFELVGDGAEGSPSAIY